MRKLLGFASLTMLTQVMLLLQQVALLPLQIHVWGHSVAATWFAAISMSAMAGVADLGLRSAGHVDLLRVTRDPGDTAAAAAFRHVWSAIRVLTAALTLGICALSMLLEPALGSFSGWKLALIVAGGLEAVLAVRITYLDSLGLYRRAESGYLLFTTVRLAVSVAALTLVGAGVEILAAIYLLTAAGALAWQSALCRAIPLLRLTTSLRGLRIGSSLAQARYTVAGPAVLWVQLHLPVLVLTAIGTPLGVTVFVALRAVFGVARQTVQQLSRAASVEHLRLAARGHQREADALLRGLAVVVSSMAACLSCLILVQRETLSHLLNIGGDPVFYRLCAVAFGLTAGFLSYQTTVAVMMRRGELARIARRQYLYIVLASAIAIAGVVSHSPLAYVALTAVVELVGAALFLIGATSHLYGRQGLVGGALCALSVAVVWWLTSSAPSLIGNGAGAWDQLSTVTAFALNFVILLAVQAALNKDLFSLARSHLKSRVP